MEGLWLLLAVAISYSRSVSALPTVSSSAPSAAATSVPAASHAGTIIGIIIPILFGIFALAIVSFLVLRRRSVAAGNHSTSITHSKEIIQLDSSSKSQVRHTAPSEFGKSKRGFMAKAQDVSKFTEFVSLYGEDGILLRELLMLASIRYLPSIRSLRTENASSEGNDNLAEASKDMTFMHSFALNTTRPSRLVALRDDLVLQGFITLREPSGQATRNQGAWAAGRQVWVARAKRDELNGTEQSSFYVDLIRIFDEIPDEGIPSIRTRRMELFYNHARLVCDFLSRKALRTPTRSITGLGISQDFRQKLIHLMMNLLTNRHQACDGKVIKDLSALMVDSDIDPTLHPRSYVMWEWAKMKQEFGSGIETSSRAVKNIVHFKESPQWPQSTVGFLLADAIQELETLQNSDALVHVLKLSDEWCDMVYQSQDHEAMSALCILLPQMQLWDKLARMPEAYHLECGYHLSRLGYPGLAERFLVSGFSACESRILGKYWRYQIELLSVIMRLGRWQEAEDKLQSSFQFAVKEYNNATSDGGFDKWQLSGDYGEFKLSINCLLADCFMAKGHFRQAEHLLRAPLDGIQGMRDQYIKAMRVAAQSRLLHAQLQLGSLPSVAATALQQCRDVIEHNDFSLDSGTMRWVVDELLTCTSELVDAGMLSEAQEIIEILAAADDRITTLLAEEVRVYIRRKQRTVLRLKTSKRSSLLSEPAPDDTIRSSLKHPSRMEEPAEIPLHLEMPKAAVTDSKDMAVNQSPIWLQEHASESSKIAQGPSPKQRPAMTLAKAPAEQRHKGQKTLSLTKLQKSLILRLSRLPLTPKTTPGLSRYPSQAHQSVTIEPRNYHLPSSSISAIEPSDFPSIPFPLIAEQVQILP